MVSCGPKTLTLLTNDEKQLNADTFVSQRFTSRDLHKYDYIFVAITSSITPAPFFFFFFNDPPPPEISPLPLHDPFPISPAGGRRSPPASLPSRAPPSRCRSPARTDRCGETSRSAGPSGGSPRRAAAPPRPAGTPTRSEEHTSELQSNLVCRLLLEKNKHH